MHRSFDPPTRFDVRAAVALPGLHSPGPQKPPLLLHELTAYVAADDSLRAIDTATGRVRATVRPRWRGVPGGAPILAEVAGRALVLAPFVVEIPGRGTTAARRLIELVAVDATTARTAWSAEVALPNWAQEPYVSVSVDTVGVGDGTLVLSAEDNYDRVTVGVNLKVRKLAWARAGFDDAVVVGNVVVGTTGDPGFGRIAALSIRDGAPLWSKAGDAEIAAGNTTVVPVTWHSTSPLVSRVTRLLDAKTGAVVGKLRGGIATSCEYDGTAITVCSDGGGWAGAFDRRGRWLWTLPNKAANRVAPRVTAVWHGAVYGQTDAGPVVLDARTGADKETDPGIAPYVVNGYVGIGATTDNQDVKAAFRTTG